MMLSQAETVDARNGSPTIRATLNDGRRLFLHSPYAPEREATRWAADLSFGPRELVILYGVGAGHGLRALLQKLGPQNLLIAVEPLEAVQRAGNSLPGLNEARTDARVRWAHSWSGVLKGLDAIENSCWRQPRLVITPAYRHLDPHSLEEFAREFLKHQKLLENFRATVFHSAEMWQANLFANLPQLAQAAPISRVFGALGQKPAIIVSAGPSLEKNVELLREAKDHALIIATGTAARMLARRGIHSDIVLAVDGGEYNFLYHFQDVSHDESVLAFDLTTYPLIPERHEGSKALIMIYPDCRWLESYMTEPIGILKTGGSVANIAFDLAQKLDADPIILIGQDLAYTGARSHADETFQDQEATQIPAAWLEGDDEKLSAEAQHDIFARWYRQRGRVEVPAAGGGMVITDRVLQSFLIWFEREIDGLRGSRTVVDATEGGALIRGTEVLSLQETLCQYCGPRIGKTIGVIREALSRPAQVDLRTLELDLCRVEAQLQDLNLIVKKATLEASADNDSPHSGNQHLRYIEHQLEELKSTFHFLFTPLLVQAQDFNSGGFQRDPEAAAQERLAFLKSIGACLEKSGGQLDNAIGSLKKYENRRHQ